MFSYVSNVLYGCRRVPIHNKGGLLRPNSLTVVYMDPLGLYRVSQASKREDPRTALFRF